MKTESTFLQVSIKLIHLINLETLCKHIYENKGYEPDLNLEAVFVNPFSNNIHNENFL